MTIVENIIFLRKARGLKKKDICQITGIDESGLCRMELGQSIPKADTLEKIAMALDARWVLVPNQ